VSRDTVAALGAVEGRVTMARISLLFARERNAHDHANGVGGSAEGARLSTMKRVLVALIAALASLLMLALPATSGAAGQDGWLSYPTCTATATALSCSGRAAIARPRPVPGLSPLMAGVIAQAHFTCTDPEPWGLFWPTLGDLQFQYVGAAVIQNGQTFSVEIPSTDFYPSTITAAAHCMFGEYVRDDPNYYNVSVVLGWGFGSATPITVQEAPIDTVSPQSFSG